MISLFCQNQYSKILLNYFDNYIVNLFHSGYSVFPSILQLLCGLDIFLGFPEGTDETFDVFSSLPLSLVKHVQGCLVGSECDSPLAGG